MARCGRCGLWNQYPEHHPEKKYAGVCLWYQVQLIEDQVYEPRECGDFIERVPGWSAREHFDHKVVRDELGTAYREAGYSRRMAYTALGLSVLAHIQELFSYFW